MLVVLPLSKGVQALGGKIVVGKNSIRASCASCAHSPKQQKFGSRLEVADRTHRKAGDVGLLHPCRYMLHDRDTPFCASFRSALASGSVTTIPFPAGRPNPHAFAKRWVRSVNQECLSKLILFGKGPLSRVLSEYSRHHQERNHHGKGNANSETAV
jgi:hypothetical protein